MVSGWDRFPGPENDYASRPGKSSGMLRFFVFAGLAGFVYLAFVLG